MPDVASGPTPSSYPRLPTPYAIRPLQVRPLLPLEVPQLPEHLPALPSPPRRVHPAIAPHYALATHLVPAAYPRISPPLPPLPPPAFSTDRKGWADKICALYY